MRRNLSKREEINLFFDKSKKLIFYNKKLDTVQLNGSRYERMPTNEDTTVVINVKRKTNSGK